MLPPRRPHARRSPSVPESVRGNRWVAIALGVTALPWLTAGEILPAWLGVAACVTAGIIAWLPDLGRPAVVGIGFFVAAAISCHPLLAGSWHPWQTSGAGDWGLAGAGLVCLPCLLMVVARAWALELLHDDQGCDNQWEEAR